MADKDSIQERELFEKCIKQKPNYFEGMLARNGDGYKVLGINWQWIGWKEARREFLPTGWKPVPAKLTQEMYEAAYETKTYVMFSRFARDYGNMIAAASKAKESTQ